MSRNRKIFLLGTIARISVFVGLLLPLLVQAQFGQNKVQYGTTHWSTIKTKHFEIFFPDSNYNLGVATADYAELAYRFLSANMKFELDKDDRISILTHVSHNQFQETNVSTESPGESTGGFTEFLKSRVVIPYEGNWEKYRHVVHHELTHAIMLRKYYGHGIQSIINGVSRMPIPLWYTEGLAEYQARFGWDTEADMFLRDAVVNDWLPSIDQFGGYLDYKGGQSVFWFLEQKYGKEKVSELIDRVPRYRDFDRGVRSALGIDTKELSERWLKWVKNEQWKSGAKLDAPTDFAMPLTDHKKQESFVNNAPSLSPQGDRIAFLSDRSDYFDIYLMNAYDGKIISRLVSGERNSNFEEMHWLQSSISWDPTGTYITFGAKAHGKDAIYTLDTRNGKVEHEFMFDLDGVFSPCWSPDGKMIAFQGWKDGVCDLYYFCIADGVIHRLINDVYTDFEPSWSPDSKSLLFTSDRADSVATKAIGFRRGISKEPLQYFEIYRIDLASKQIERLTHDGAVARSPVWIPGDSAFLYVSNRTGIANLYRFALPDKSSKALTNVLTGIFQPSISNQRSIAFASFYRQGYDIYMMSTPLSKPQWKDPPDTPFRAMNRTYPVDPATLKKSVADTISEPQPVSLSNYVFDDLRTGSERYKKFKQEELKKANTTPVKIDTVVADTQTVFTVNKYKVRISPDLLFANAGYSSLAGFQGMGQFMLSDVLGNHVIEIATDLYYDIENTNINAMYYYLPHRIDYGIGGFHNVFFFNYNWTRDRSYGVVAVAQYPLTKYMRFNLSANYINIIRSRFTLDENDYVTLASRHVLMPGIAFVKDNSVWGYAGPATGERYRIEAYWSPAFQDNTGKKNGTKWGMDFKTVMGDYRRYIRINRDYGVALRLSGGASEGKSAQRFFIGGEANSLNRTVKNSQFVRDVDNVFFSTQVTPLRGLDLYDVSGTRYGLFNAEFRYPLIRMLALGFPLPAYIGNIRGSSFIDAGGTWDNDRFRGAIVTESGATQLKDMKFGFGFGARASLGFAILKYDVAWNSDWLTTKGPEHYISLGTEF